MRGRKEKGEKRQEEAAKGVPQVTDFAQRTEGRTLAPQHRSGALELCCPPLRPEMPLPLGAPIPASTLLAVRGAPFLSLAPHSHPQPLLIARALLPLPPHAPCLLPSFRQHHQPISSPSSHYTGPHTPRKGRKQTNKQAAPPPALTPSRLIFSTVARSPNAGSKMGIPPSPGSLSKAPNEASRAQMPPCLSSLRSLLFVYDGPSRDVVYFRLFTGVIFFLFSFIFLAWGPQR